MFFEPSVILKLSLHVIHYIIHMETVQNNDIVSHLFKYLKQRIMRKEVQLDGWVNKETNGLS